MLSCRIYIKRRSPDVASATAGPALPVCSHRIAPVRWPSDLQVRTGRDCGKITLVRLCCTSKSRISQIINNFLCYDCRDYVRNELESEYDGPIYLEPLTMNRFTTALIGKELARFETFVQYDFGFQLLIF